MTLTFLGQEYEATPTEIVAIESEVTGLYRGHPVKFSHCRMSPRSNVTLTYRGIRYTR